jgi:hypothetical protein
MLLLDRCTVIALAFACTVTCLPARAEKIRPEQSVYAETYIKLSLAIEQVCTAWRAAYEKYEATKPSEEVNAQVVAKLMASSVRLDVVTACEAGRAK